MRLACRTRPKAWTAGLGASRWICSTRRRLPPCSRQCRRVLKTGGRIVVVGMSKEGEHGLVYEAYEWTHRHFPNFVDCRPIMVSHVLAAAGFQVTEKQN